jgi:hypothetical protein
MAELTTEELAAGVRGLEGALARLAGDATGETERAEIEGILDLIPRPTPDAEPHTALAAQLAASTITMRAVCAFGAPPEVPHAP